MLAGSPTIVAKANNEARVRGGLEHEAYLWHDLKGLIDEAGGKDALLACGGVFSGPFQTQMVAYELGIHGIQVGWKVTPPPGVTFRTRTVPDGPLVTKPTDDRYRLVAHQRQVAAADGAAGRAQRLSQGEPLRAHLGHRRQRRDQGRAARGDRRPAAAAGSTSERRGHSLGSPGWPPSPPAYARCPSVRSLPSSFVLPALVLLGLLAVSFYLRTHSLGESLWMDEGLSIGIASQPLFDIPGVLRVDGSPPLYYMLLSVWMDVTGNGPAETQGLSVAIALLAVPGGLWAGWSLFGRRAGLICAALCAVNPFLTAYAQETRMYALMLVLSLLATAAFLHVFAFGRRSYLPLFSVLLALMLYTHNWGLFLAAGLVCALVPCWYVSEVRSSFWKDALIGFGFAGLLYLPWLPTLLHQVQHTGAPWLNPPNFGAPVQITKSLLGGGTPTVALLLAGGSGIAAVIARRVEDKERTAVIAGAVTVLATLAVAWLVSQVSPAWTTRYLGVLLGPMLLIAALGLARAGALGMVALVIILGIWAIPALLRAREQVERRRPAQVGRPELQEGDLVVSMQPEQGPLLAYHLEDLGGAPKLRFASPIGAVENDRIMDWTDGYDKLKDATPAANLEPLLANLPPGGRVLFVYPVTGARTIGMRPGPSSSGAGGRSGARRSRPTRASRRWRRCPKLPPCHADRRTRRDLREEDAGTG